MSDESGDDAARKAQLEKTSPELELFLAESKKRRIAAVEHNTRRRERLAMFKRAMPVVPLSVPQLGTPVQSALIKGMWLSICVRMWTDGPIPNDPKILAQAAGVSLRTWKCEELPIERMFKRTGEGKWFDPWLEELRQEALEEIRADGGEPS